MLRSVNSLIGLGYRGGGSQLCQCRRHSFASFPNLLLLSAPHRRRRSRLAPAGASPAMYSNASHSAPVSATTAHKPNVSFCQSCGGLTKQVVPDGEEKMRSVCTLCGKIHYENPKMVVGCLVEHGDKILLCKRKIPPSSGFWTLPAGFMEIGESAVEGATRETLEEACAEVEVLSPFAQLDIPLIGQTYIIFRAKLKKPHFSPGPESLECALFGPDDIPFDSLAFSSIIVTLRMYVEDIKTRNFKFHYCTIHKRCWSFRSHRFRRRLPFAFVKTLCIYVPHCLRKPGPSFVCSFR